MNQNTIKDMSRYTQVELGIIHPLILITFVPMITASGYGFDSASSCDPNVSRKSRSAQLIQTIPCDLSIQAYCNLPGSAYPWHAVRRFVHENQGLMRRMYGDVRHISILKSEIDTNKIDIDDIHQTAEKYSRKDAKKMRHVHFTHYEHGREKFSDVITEPHFRPSQRGSTVKINTSTVSTTTVPYSTTTSADNTINTSDRSTLLNITINASTKSSQQNTSNIFAPIRDNEKIDMKKLSAIANLETSDTLREMSQSSTANIFETSHTDRSKIDQTTTILGNNSDEKDIPGNFTPVKTNKIVTKIDTTNVIKTTTRKPEEQLYQDSTQKEPTLLNMKGINACPVKEEVVAPFWANNTRGEVLALLNLYPFEQYVHWEKCAFEFKQMYCREGCRCEQQYRLHRLLAYDPHNECRGIFSDWFRFPSCCICKCYDLPFDYRVTSRSPRTVIEESFHYVEDDLQNAIYEHATDDWYRPKKPEHG
ncbi:protein spaetzle 4 isoform X2 [Wyeomyia smithii]|uniref:protein spaetzle 4 isoform X2 n=1 Tax=Wyeomyia smithii TaxID=174621 RepID=UPI0024682068|nr:protein spaetzle 4 isoform X2 [Wyeomyia smithii]